MKITIQSLREAEGPLRLGDVSYFCPETPNAAQFGQFAKWASGQEWFTPIAKKYKLQPPFRRLGFILLEILKREYEQSCPSTFGTHSHEEPDWLGLLPKYARYYIRKEYLLGDGGDPFAILRNFPYMGFGYMIHADGLAHEACQVFNLFRLQEVRQLAFLHDPVQRESDRSMAAQMFEHTRYCHVLDTYAVSRLIAHNCRLNELETNTLIVAAISHDALTPAGGDTTKLVDPPAFDEDANFPELLKGEKWEEFQVKWKLDKDLLAQTILGKGKLGKLLDICDKTSYISRDCHRFLGVVHPEQNEGLSTGHFAIASIARENPLVTKLWDEVYVKNGEVIVGNAKRLYSFLTLRAFMFKYLYYNPYSRFFEYLVGGGVTKHLYNSGKITREDLLTYGDRWLEKKIDEFFGVNYVMYGLLQLDNARMEEHLTEEEAYARVAEFDSDENVLAVVDDFAYGSGSSTKKFLVPCRGGVAAFAEAYRNESLQIDSIMHTKRLYRVYFFYCSDLGIPQNRRRHVKEVFEERSQAKRSGSRESLCSLNFRLSD